MAKIIHSIIIKAPPEKVFGYIGDPANIRQIWPGVEYIKESWPLPNGGYGSCWVYRLGGVLIEGDTKTTEWLVNQRIVFSSRGPAGLQAVAALTVEPDAAGTRLVYNVEYLLPIPLLGGPLADWLHRQNDAEAEWLLKNLKANLERQEILQYGRPSPALN